jgi:hypothetical protein
MRTLDVSWIEQEEQILNMSENADKISATHIPLKCIYIDQHNSVIFTESDQIELTPNLTRKNVDAAIETYRRSYQFIDAAIFILDIDHSNIQAFSKSTVSPESAITYFKQLPLPIHEYIVAPTLPLFHSDHCVYLFFKEPVRISVPPSILKSASHASTQKRVRIAPVQPISRSASSRHTRRRTV